MLFHHPPLISAFRGDVGTNMTMTTDFPFRWALQAEPRDRDEEFVGMLRCTCQRMANALALAAVRRPPLSPCLPDEHNRHEFIEEIMWHPRCATHRMRLGYSSNSPCASAPHAARCTPRLLPFQGDLPHCSMLWSLESIRIPTHIT